ncbi:MAG: tetratricopeptide repeat protein [Nitrospirae bacterium]|nr:tetratricopeptide repeat protein [Nitrospirota bacterium]
MKIKVKKNTAPASGRFFLFALLLIPSIAFLMYSNILNAPFIFDDVAFLDNPMINISRLPQLLDILFDSNLDRRAGFITFAMNFYLGGLNPFGYHLFNIIIHILNALALFYLVKMTLSLPSAPERFKSVSGEIALAGSLLWLVQPVHIMAVTYTVQRLASLSSLFFLLSLISYISARQSSSSKRLLHSCLSVICGVIALSTKQNAAVLPFVVVLYEFYFFEVLSFKEKRKKILLFSSVAVISLMALVLVYLGPDFLKEINARYIERGITPYQRLITEFRVVVMYLTLLLYPHPSRLNVDYDFTLSTGIFSPISTLFSLIFLGGLLAFAIYRARKTPLFSFCILWFFMNLAVESTIYPLDLVFEHRLYLPSMGIAMLFAGYVITLENSQIKKVGMALIVLAIFVFAFWTHERNYLWNSQVTLWEDNAGKSPDKARVHGNLGKAYLDNNEFEKARVEFEKVIRIDPAYLGAYDNLAVIYIDYFHDYEKAKEYIDKAIRIDPEYSVPYINSGVINLQLRQLPEAVENFKKALELDPESHLGHYNLAAAYFNLRDYAAAISILKKGINLWPASSKLYGLLGVTYFHDNDKENASKALRYAVKLDPQNKMAAMYLEKL